MNKCAVLFILKTFNSVKYVFHCTYASRYVLPSVTRAIVVELRRRGYSVSQISRMLGVTPAAVSQYLRGKRGKALSVEGTKIRAIVDSLVRGEDVSGAICALCREVSAGAPR